MRKTEIASILSRQPFVPLKIVKTDGSTADVPFSHVVHLMSRSLIVFKGVEREGSRVAKNFEEIVYDRIAQVEPDANRGRSRRKKAS